MRGCGKVYVKSLTKMKRELITIRRHARKRPSRAADGLEGGREQSRARRGTELFQGRSQAPAGRRHRSGRARSPAAGERCRRQAAWNGWTGAFSLGAARPALRKRRRTAAKRLRIGPGGMRRRRREAAGAADK